MGKYRATMNLGGHRRGDVKEYDDADPQVAVRVKAGLLTGVDGAKPTGAAPEPAKKASARKAKKADAAPVEAVEDVPVEAVADAAEEPVVADSAPEAPEVVPEPEEPRVTFGSGVQTAFRSDSED